MSSSSSSKTNRKARSSPSKAPAFSIYKGSASRSASNPTHNATDSLPGANFIINFGKYRGLPVSKIPAEWVDWAIEKGALRCQPGLQQAVTSYRSESENRELRILSERENNLKPKLPEWFFNECMKAFGFGLTFEEQVMRADESNIFGGSGTEERETKKAALEAMEDMLKYDPGLVARTYQVPRVEGVSLPDPETSESVKAFRKELALFPKLYYLNRSGGDLERKTEGILVFDCPVWEGFPTWEIDDRYKRRLEKCFEDIKAEHGVSMENVARWEVRNTHAKYFDGLRYVGDGVWEDSSVMWLKGK
ncbi:hypothetical protein K435DRAFT_786115 [Dendrothele bispora CBS 962.96]|uniref:Uncharacterized protein n=1 Tax=Dendrothele bispora (strain CBS 962.96) TaxID=1314807 RepID=A0A4S8KTK0_DENBC|nr:hypothetical protein K435DRAFT_786115 [Dendrothele bispora CBS 962.96]